MKYLMVLWCMGLLAGCLSGLANRKDIPLADSDSDQPTASEGQMSDSAPTPEEVSMVATPTTFRADLEDYGAAPELTNDVWLNTDQPLRLAELRGKVVLLEMWTFG